MKVVITLSKTFFPKHPKAGEKTDFERKVKNGIACMECPASSPEACAEFCCAGRSNDLKIHTCRSNYKFWRAKIARLKEVGGVLSIRQWSGKPFWYPQEIIMEIPAEIVGVQRLLMIRDGHNLIPYVDGKPVSLEDLSANDGLDVLDFKDWFRPAFGNGLVIGLEFSIIHFTTFRY